MDDTSTIASQIAQLRRTVSEDDEDSGDQVRLSAQREHVEAADMPMCALCAACVLNTAWASFPELSLSTAIPEGHVHFIALVNSPLSSPVASTLSGSLTSEDSRASQATTKGTAEARMPFLLRRSPERPRAQGALHERVPIQDWSVREPRN